MLWFALPIIAVAGITSVRKEKNTGYLAFSGIFLPWIVSSIIYDSRYLEILSPAWVLFSAFVLCLCSFIYRLCSPARTPFSGNQLIFESAVRSMFVGLCAYFAVVIFTVCRLTSLHYLPVLLLLGALRLLQGAISNLLSLLRNHDGTTPRKAVMGGFLVCAVIVLWAVLSPQPQEAMPRVHINGPESRREFVDSASAIRAGTLNTYLAQKKYWAQSTAGWSPVVLRPFVFQGSFLTNDELGELERTYHASFGVPFRLGEAQGLRWAAFAGEPRDDGFRLLSGLEYFIFDRVLPRPVSAVASLPGLFLKNPVTTLVSFCSIPGYLWDSFVSYLESGFSFVISIPEYLWDCFVACVRSSWNSFVACLKFVISIPGYLWDCFISCVRSVFSFVISIPGFLWESLVGALSRVFNPLARAMYSVFDSVYSFACAIPSFFSGVASAYSSGIDTVSTIATEMPREIARDLGKVYEHATRNGKVAMRRFSDIFNWFWSFIVSLPDRLYNLCAFLVALPGQAAQVISAGWPKLLALPGNLASGIYQLCTFIFERVGKKLTLLCDMITSIPRFLLECLTMCADGIYAVFSPVGSHIYSVFEALHHMTREIYRFCADLPTVLSHVYHYLSSCVYAMYEAFLSFWAAVFAFPGYVLGVVESVAASIWHNLVTCVCEVWALIMSIPDLVARLWDVLERAVYGIYSFTTAIPGFLWDHLTTFICNVWHFLAHVPEQAVEEWHVVESALLDLFFTRIPLMCSVFAQAVVNMVYNRCHSLSHTFPLYFSARNEMITPADWLSINARDVWIRSQSVNVRPAELSGEGLWIAEVEIVEDYDLPKSANVREMGVWFDLPPSTTLVNITVEVDDFVKSAEISPRGAVQKLFEESTPQQKAPLVLENVGPGKYRLRFTTTAFSWGDNRLRLRMNYITFPLSSREGASGLELSWPLPVLTQRRNVYFNHVTSRVIQGEETASVWRLYTDWYPPSVTTRGHPVASQPNRTISTNFALDGKPYTVTLSELVKATIVPRPQQSARVALLLDTSFRMGSLVDRVNLDLQAARKHICSSLSGDNKPTLDLYFGDAELDLAHSTPTTMRSEDLCAATSFVVDKYTFFGSQSMSSVWRQFWGQTARVKYDYVTILSNEAHQEGLVNGQADKSDFASGALPVVSVLFLGPNQAEELADSVSDLLLSSGGGVVGTMRQFLLSVGERDDSVDNNRPRRPDSFEHLLERPVKASAGYEGVEHQWSVAPAEKDTTISPPSSPGTRMFQQLAGHHLSKTFASCNGLAKQHKLQCFDVAHDLARSLHFISSFSSFVIPNDRKLLERLAADESRFDRQRDERQFAARGRKASTAKAFLEAVPSSSRAPQAKAHSEDPLAVRSSDEAMDVDDSAFVSAAHSTVPYGWVLLWLVLAMILK